MKTPAGPLLAGRAVYFEKNLIKTMQLDLFTGKPSLPADLSSYWIDNREPIPGEEPVWITQRYFHFCEEEEDNDDHDHDKCRNEGHFTEEEECYVSDDGNITPIHFGPGSDFDGLFYGLISAMPKEMKLGCGDDVWMERSISVNRAFYEACFQEY